MPDSLLARLPAGQRRLLLAVIGALVAWFAWTVRSVLNPIVLGYLLAFVLSPSVRRLERRGLSRLAAVAVIFGAFGLTLTAVGFGVVHQARALGRDFAEEDGPLDEIELVLDRGARSVTDGLARFGLELGAPPEEAEEPSDSAAPDAEAPGEDEEGSEERPSGALRELLLAVQRQFGAEDGGGARQAGLAAAGGLLGLLARVTGSAFALLSLLFLWPIYTFFFLFELERIHAYGRRFLPPRDAPQLLDVGEQLGRVLSSFFRGRLLVCLLKGLFLTVGLLAAGVPYALLLGLASGFLALVPFVGPLCGFLVSIAAALLAHTPLGALLRTSIVFGAAELLEGYVLLPKILGDQMGLHPAVVLASLTIGAAAFGLLGLLISVPLAAAIIVVARELVLPAVEKSMHEL